MASGSYKNCFQCAGVSLTELVNETAVSPTTNLSIVPLKIHLTVPAVSIPGSI